VAKSMNQVTILGNLTRDPELRSTPAGQDVVNFGLALNRSYKDSAGEWQEATDYVDIAAWGTLAGQVANSLHKGSRVLISGRLNYRAWEQDGTKRSKLEVVANDVMFLDRPEATEGD
jgi:single-strand DNA-binding protein